MRITDVGLNHVSRSDHIDWRAGWGDAKYLLGCITLHSTGWGLLLGLQVWRGLCTCLSVAGSQASTARRKTTKSIEMHAVWVWTCKAQGTITVFDGAGISYENRHFWKMVILGHTQTCLRSILSTLFTKRQQRCGLWLRVSGQLVYFVVLVVLFVELF